MMSKPEVSLSNLWMIPGLHGSS
ncbi:hypothetical protein CP8484711_0059A, partial [Chlamydia psittaci 84-8471/1]